MSDIIKVSSLNFDEMSDKESNNTKSKNKSDKKKKTDTVVDNTGNKKDKNVTPKKSNKKKSSTSTKKLTSKKPKKDKTENNTTINNNFDENVANELDKVNNLQESIPTNTIIPPSNTIVNDKVQIDLSSTFGPGTFAELEGDDAIDFLNKQGTSNTPTFIAVGGVNASHRQSDPNVNKPKKTSNKSSEKKTVETIQNEEFSNTATAVPMPSSFMDNIPMTSQPILHSNPSTPSNTFDDDIPHEIMVGGNPKCYAYLSLKATGVYKPDIISFALVTEEGKAFYAEMKDIDVMKITPNILVNVIQMRFNLKTDDMTPGRVCVVGDDKYIRSKLLDWIREEFTDKGLIMQIVSDKVVNEFGLFMELLLNGIPLEEYHNMVSPVCIDLNTILASNLDIGKQDGMDKDEFIKGYIPAYIASDVNRLDIVSDDTPTEYLGNALVHAQCIRAVYRRLYGFDNGEEYVNLINKKE